jgi:4-alpha-glucanotransferase
MWVQSRNAEVIAPSLNWSATPLCRSLAIRPSAAESKPMTNDQSDLHELARLYGVEIQYDDIFGRRIASPPEAILWVAKALGAEAEGMGDVGHAVRARQARLSERVVDPVTVAWDTEPAAVSMQLHPDMANCLAICTIALENGETLRKKINLADLPPDGVSEFGEASRVIKRLPLPDSIPWGYHRATIMINGTEYTTRLICAPVETYQGDGDDSVQRTWGVFAPLYALHSERSWGSGDFTDLESLTAMVGDLGGGLVSTLPLLPTQLDHEVAPSPYSPTSRLLWNEFYLDVTRIPELESAPAARDLLNSEAIRAELDSLRAATI